MSTEFEFDFNLELNLDVDCCAAVRSICQNTWSNHIPPTICITSDLPLECLVCGEVLSPLNYSPRTFVVGLYLEGQGRHQGEYEALVRRIPAQGSAENEALELLRAATTIYHRHYNDGDHPNNVIREFMPVWQKLSTTDREMLLHTWRDAVRCTPDQLEAFVDRVIVDVWERERGSRSARASVQ